MAPRTSTSTGVGVSRTLQRLAVLAPARRQIVNIPYRKVDERREASSFRG